MVERFRAADDAAAAAAAAAVSSVATFTASDETTSELADLAIMYVWMPYLEVPDIDVSRALGTAAQQVDKPVWRFCPQPPTWQPVQLAGTKFLSWLHPPCPVTITTIALSPSPPSPIGHQDASV